MIQSISAKALARTLQAEHPAWTAEGAAEHAEQLIRQTDERLSEAVRLYVSDEIESDYHADGMSLLGLRALLNCTYLDAVEVMSVWLNDQEAGRALITRRGMAR